MITETCSGALLLQQYNFDDFAFEISPIEVNKYGGNIMQIAYKIETYLLTTSFVKIRVKDPNLSLPPTDYSLIEEAKDADFPQSDKAYMSIFLGMYTCMYVCMYVCMNVCMCDIMHS